MTDASSTQWDYNSSNTEFISVFFKPQYLEINQVYEYLCILLFELAIFPPWHWYLTILYAQSVNQEVKNNN